MSVISGPWQDFNNAPDQGPSITHTSSVGDVRASLMDQLHVVLGYLFPAGKTKHNQFVIGDVDGTPGKSLSVELTGPRAGMWMDFATGEGGDVIDLWAKANGLNAKRDFKAVMDSIGQWLHLPTQNREPPLAPKKNVPMDDLGPVTQKWDYRDAKGKLIACVYRYDPPTGKEFRPWDINSRTHRAPDPRPLYNQPQIDKATDVVLVEGEKAADALIQKGVVATTAMNGANAPIDKTDWSPLVGKRVTIWPDNDEAGITYAQKAAQAIASAGAETVSVLQIPEHTPPKWDAYDAVEQGMDVWQFISITPSTIVKGASQAKAVTLHSLGELLSDTSPMPEDLIAPRVLTPRGMVVLGGAPKVGKSDFLLSWLTHMAAGKPFLGLKPARPLKVFYLQAEVQYHYLRERVQSMELPTSIRVMAAKNLFVTPQLQLLLNEQGMDQVLLGLKNAALKEEVDVLVIDPIRNVFDGGPEGNSENDNNAMLFFLRERIEKLRDAINPEAGIILVHHTKKINKKQVEEDPFLALSGAGSLRGYYTAGMLLYRTDEYRTDRTLVFELRNGPGITPKIVDKSQGEWRELDLRPDRIVNQDYGAKLDAERERKRELIVQIIFDEAAQGRVYTSNQFAETFEGRAGLGANRTINERISVHASKGDIKFFRNPEDYRLPPLSRSKYGYLCVENMTVPIDKNTNNEGEDEARNPHLSIKPTHYKCAQTGALLPVENPDIWVYQEDVL